jgi:hypothetical protein
MIDTGECGCSGSFTPSDPVGIYGQLTVESDLRSVTGGGGGPASSSDKVELWNGGFSTLHVDSDSHGFFDLVNTEVTIVIPYAGRWDIILENFHTFYPNGWSSDDDVMFNNTVYVGDVSTTVTANGGPVVNDCVGTLEGSDYIYRLENQYYSEGQHVMIKFLLNYLQPSF